MLEYLFASLLAFAGIAVVVVLCACVGKKKEAGEDVGKVEAAVTREAELGDRKERILKAVGKMKGIDKVRAETLVECIDTCSEKISFEMIVGLTDVKRVMRESIVLPFANPQILPKSVTPTTAILLFGPSGTGKTYIAKALAAETSSVVLEVSAPLILSKWIGESEKGVQTLFKVVRQVARQVQPVILFIDDIDSLMPKRGQGATTRVTSEFLLQMDGSKSRKDDRMVVIGATNRPFAIDPAFYRRFGKRLFVPLPDLADRKELVRRLLAGTRHILSEKDVDEIAAETDGYSCHDVKMVFDEAMLEPLRILTKAMQEKVKANELRPVSIADFRYAIVAIKPTNSVAEMKKLEEFRKRYGTGT